MWPAFTVLENDFPVKAMQESARKKLDVSQKQYQHTHLACIMYNLHHLSYLKHPANVTSNWNKQ